MRNILIIARRDLGAQFNSPVAYVVIGGTMLLLGVLFFLLPHVGGGFLMGSFWELDKASLEPLFGYLPLLMSLFVVPAVTMRSLAAEKGVGTLELLITMPVRDREVILGKYIASCAIVLILLATTLLYPIVLFLYPWHLGTLDWGPVWSGYLGCALFSCAAVGVGLMISSLTESDVIAFFLTFLALFGLYAVGWIVALLPGVLGDAVGFISFQTRYQAFPKGVIDTRAIIYFVSVAIVCLLVSFRSLESRKWS
ncbi:MAG: ABC transporter permease [Polyangiaceae bacterium]|nr:ABC transporter permease [Polyangiaceae bacterium]